MNTLRIALTAGAVLLTAAPALAQYQAGQQEAGYRDAQDRYRADSVDYEARRLDYQNRRAEYDRNRADYDARRQTYENQRYAYDERHGQGAYARRFGPEPAWDPHYYDNSRYASTPAYRQDNRGRDYVDPCTDGSNRKSGEGKIPGGVIGVLAGAAVGSNVAAHGRKTEGAVLGSVVGGLLGYNIGKSVTKARCDQSGYYYNKSDTRSYRESREDGYARSGENDYSYYRQQGCRLATAPVDRTGDVRYVRVCPDQDGRYRITR